MALLHFKYAIWAENHHSITISVHSTGYSFRTKPNRTLFFEHNLESEQLVLRARTLLTRLLFSLQSAAISFWFPDWLDPVPISGLFTPRFILAITTILPLVWQQLHYSCWIHWLWTASPEFWPFACFGLYPCRLPPLGWQQTTLSLGTTTIWTRPAVEATSNNAFFMNAMKCYI